MKKYLFISLNIICGEYEFNHSTVKELENYSDSDIENYPEWYAENFYKDDEGVAVSVNHSSLISEKEYNVLKKYI